MSGKLWLFEDDEPVNDIEQSWLHGDWERIKEVSQADRVKPENELFAILDAITMKRDCDIERMTYSKWAIEAMLSRHLDCIQVVSNANMFLRDVPDSVHFEYLRTLIPQGRKFSKNSKLPSDIKDIFIFFLLAKFYNCSAEKVVLYKHLLENKGNLSSVLSKCKIYVTDDLLKSVTKNPKEQKELKALL